MSNNHDDILDLFDDDDLDFDNIVLDEDEFEDTRYEDTEYESIDYDDEDDEDDEDELFTRKRVKNKASGPLGSKKMVFIAVIAVILILFLIGGFLLTRDGGNDSSGGHGSSFEDDTSTEEQTTEPPRETLAVDTNADVNQMMIKYHDAVKRADLVALGEVIDTTEKISLQKMTKRSEYIEDYQNIKCYTLDGMEAGTYLVFVEYDLKFVNINTAAPSADYYYVKTRSDGSLYVCTSKTDEEQAFIDTQLKKEAVVNLIIDVNARFKAMINSDEKLKGFVELLKGGEEVTPPEPDETSPTPEETTPEETTPEATTPEQTEPEGDYSYINADDVSFRSSADNSSSDNIIGLLSSGTKVNILSLEGEWYRVQMVDDEDSIGFVYKDFVTK